jgi:hypothetical protein
LMRKRSGGGRDLVTAYCKLCYNTLTKATVGSGPLTVDSRRIASPTAAIRRVRAATDRTKKTPGTSGRFRVAEAHASESIKRVINSAFLFFRSLFDPIVSRMASSGKNSFCDNTSKSAKSAADFAPAVLLKS